MDVSYLAVHKDDVVFELNKRARRLKSRLKLDDILTGFRVELESVIGEVGAFGLQQAQEVVRFAETVQQAAKSGFEGVISGVRHGMKGSLVMVQTPKGPMVVALGGHVGEGTYGKVLRGYPVLVTGEPVDVVFKKVDSRRLEGEYGMLQRASVVKGVNRCLGRVGEDLLVLEYVPSIKVRDLALFEDKLDVVKQLLAIVQDLHRHRICHRDVKLKNVLRDPDTGNVVLADFGSARYFEPGESFVRSEKVGSPTHASPEVIAGVPSCCKADDLWSVGVVMMKLLYGVSVKSRDDVVKMDLDDRLRPLAYGLFGIEL